MMMLAMVVGVALLVGAAVKKFMPSLWGQLAGMISSGVQYGAYDAHKVGR